MKRLLALFLAAVLVFGLVACAGNEPPAPTAEPSPEPPAAQGIFTPGTFTGVGTGGYGGDITVEVTFDEFYILSVEVVEHSETDMFADIALAVLVPGVIEA